MIKALRMGLVLALTLVGGEVWAIRQIGFQTDAFNRAYPASYRKSIVFSPMSFELDCAIIAEALETIPKANVSETMGVVLDFESSYGPVLQTYGCTTNCFSVVTARGFCVQDPRKVLPAVRHNFTSIYGVEVLPSYPIRGAEAWFKTTMEGLMEDFALPSRQQREERYYSFYDLISVEMAWKEPFPTENTRKMRFHPDGEEGEGQVMDFMSDVRIADTWDAPDYTLLRLPLEDDAYFYAIMPHEGKDLSDVRRDLSSLKISKLLTITQSLTESGVAHGPCVIALPKFEQRSELDIARIFEYFRVPTRGLKHIAGNAVPRNLQQRVRFKLAEQGPKAKALEKKSAERQVSVTPETKKLVFNRPFVYFIHHEPTATIPIAGQYCGE